MKISEKLKAFAKKVKIEIKIYKIVLKDKKTPKLGKIFLGAGVTYALNPIDIIPDFIPLLGYVDDIIIVPLLIFIGLKFIPKKIVEKHRKIYFKNLRKLNLPCFNETLHEFFYYNLLSKPLSAARLGKIIIYLSVNVVVNPHFFWVWWCCCHN